MSTDTNIGIATMGGRGIDPDLLDQLQEMRTAPASHIVHGARTVTWSSPTPGLSAVEAFEARVKRLREAGTPHEADRATLTIDYTTEADGMTTTVHLGYTEAPS